MTPKRRFLIYKLIAVALVLVFVLNAKLVDHLPIIDLRVVVTVLGVDKTDDGYHVSAHIVIPVAGGGSDFNQDIVEADGKTLSEAFDRLNISSGEKVEVSRCGMFFFGRGICDEGILEETKTILSIGELNAGIIILTSDTDEAKDCLKKALDMNKESSSNVNSFISYFENSLYMPELTLIDFVSESVGESQCSFIPCIELQEGSGGGEGESGGGDSSGGDSGGGGAKAEESGSVSKSTTIKNMSNIAIFKKGKRVALLNKNQSQGLIWCQKGSKRGFLETDEFKYSDKSYGNLSGDVISKKASIKCSFVDGKPHVKVKIRAKVDIRDRSRITYDMDKGIVNRKSFHAAISKEFENRIELMAAESFAAMKDYDCDFMGILYKFYRLKCREITQYQNSADNDFLRDLTVEFDVKCNVN